MEIFWETIANYNLSTWEWQSGLIASGIFLTALISWYLRPWTCFAMKLYLIVISVWIAVVYYGIFCDGRDYNNVMGWFWGIIAVVWGWDLLTGFTTFEPGKKYRYLSSLLLVMPFIYPLVSWSRGLEFPVITSPVMPCSVVAYMFGLQLKFARKVNLFLTLLLCHWSFIGLSKTYAFNIPEDFLLSAASLPVVYLLFKDYFTEHLQEVTKPSVKYIQGLLLLVFIGLAGILLRTFFYAIFS